MRELLPPEKLLAEINGMFPGIWKEVDRIRALRGTEIPEWDQHVFLPMKYWQILFGEFGKLKNLPLTELAYMQLCVFLAAWRPGQDVARFNPWLYQSLIETPLSGDLPSEILWRLPAWAIYVETPGLQAYGAEWDGYLAMLNQRGREDKRELRIIFMNGAGESLAELLSLGDWSLQEAMVLGKPGILKNPGSRFDIPEEAGPSKPYPALEAAISLLLYICAYGFLEDRHLSLSNSSYPSAKRTKKGWRIFPPDQPKVHEVGREIGNALRDLSHSVKHGVVGERKSPRPHLRRAHWHGFWSGPRKDAEKRRFDLTWLPPTMVAMADEKISA